MTDTVHILIEAGEDKGLRITVPPGGGRLGRSSKNDFVLRDPLLSRHHCRLYFKPDQGLWITDLGSANDTIVNGKQIHDERLRPGDVIMLGDTVLKVLNDGTESAPTPAAPVAAPVAAPTPDRAKETVPEPVVDLGLAPPKPLDKKATRKLSTGPLLIIGSLVIALALAAWVPKLFRSNPSEDEKPTSPSDPSDYALEINYEKVQANPKNVFRYNLQITGDHVLAVQIDDLENNRHLRKEKKLDADYTRELASFIFESGFFALRDEYRGVQPDLLEQWEITVSVGRRTHSVCVANRLEPEPFKAVRERIEVCGKNELGLWTMPFSTEELIQMADESHLRGQKLYDEREIRYGNLAAAMKDFEEASWYLEEVEPKPDFFSEILASLSDCKRELQEQYDDFNFKAERAIRMRSWEEAAVALRTICEMIPDRADPRNGEARRKLLDVETRMDSDR